MPHITVTAQAALPISTMVEWPAGAGAREYLSLCSIAAGDDVPQEGAAEQLQGGCRICEAEARAGEAEPIRPVQRPQRHDAHRPPSTVQITLPASP